MAQEIIELKYVKSSCKLSQDEKVKLDEQLSNWLEWDGNEETKNEIQQLLDGEEWQK